jgi:hypothetical protein
MWVGGRLARQALAAGLAGGRVTIILARLTLGAGQRVLEDLVNLWTSGTSDCAGRP